MGRTTVDDDQQDSNKGWRKFRRLKVEKGTIKRRARKIENATLKHAHKFLIRRWTNIRDVGRNTIAWLVAVGLLIALAATQAVWFQDAYTTRAPQSGGTYAEGMLGRLETINPLFASTVAETSAEKLIFSSLLTYDVNDKLTPDAADSWTVSQDGKVYDVVLRSDILWHDGKQMTADDVVFTVHLMQDETVRATQYGSWAGVKVEKVSQFAVRFTLPAVFAPFAHSLTFGILPKHILKDIPPYELRENDFGRHPVGSGPFSFRRIQVIDPSKDRLVVHMEANSQYYRGEPLLNRFQVHTYENRTALYRAFKTSEINAALGLGVDEIDEVTSQNDSFDAGTTTVANGMYAIFNNDSPLMRDSALRQAFVVGTNRQKLSGVLRGRTIPLEGPLTSAYASPYGLQQSAYNQKLAGEKLDALGWKKAAGILQKEGKKLEISVVAPDTGDYKLVVDELTSQWEALGVTVKVQFVDPAEIVQDYLQPRNYDVLVYELAIGADPDVYAYWHSSQAKPSGLNLANYRSGLADDSLSSARSRLEPNLRQAKYKTFTEQWLKDAPAIALYQPYLSYVMNTGSSSLEPHGSVPDLATRYRTVEHWSVSDGRVMRTP